MQKTEKNTLTHIDYHPGNYFPFINDQTATKKGCKYIHNMINQKSFQHKESSCMDKLRAIFQNVSQIKIIKDGKSTQHEWPRI